MHANKKSMRATWNDPDDAPELTEAWFEKAELREGERVIRRGRPKSAAPNVAVSLRIPPEVLERWKSAGWLR
jgi:uncharacterized protein (DUF4415 family)